MRQHENDRKKASLNRFEKIEFHPLTVLPLFVCGWQLKFNLIEQHRAMG
jgi:hypothetical protein